MPVIRCTKKLLNVMPPIDIGKVGDASSVWDWHANLVMVNRQKCVLFTHDKTLYGFLIMGLKKKDFAILDHFFLEGLFRRLRLDGFGQKDIEHALNEHHGKISYNKTNSRSVLGSMNDYVKILWYYLEATDFSLDTYNAAINSMPMSAIGCRFPKEAMAHLLATGSTVLL